MAEKQQFCPQCKSKKVTATVSATTYGIIGYILIGGCLFLGFINRNFLFGMLLGLAAIIIAPFMPLHVKCLDCDHRYKVKRKDLYE